MYIYTFIISYFSNIFIDLRALKINALSNVMGSTTVFGSAVLDRREILKSKIKLRAELEQTGRGVASVPRNVTVTDNGCLLKC